MVIDGLAFSRSLETPASVLSSVAGVSLDRTSALFAHARFSLGILFFSFVPSSSVFASLDLWAKPRSRLGIWDSHNAALYQTSLTKNNDLFTPS